MTKPVDRDVRTRCSLPHGSPATPSAFAPFGDAPLPPGPAQRHAGQRARARV